MVETNIQGQAHSEPVSLPTALTIEVPIYMETDPVKITVDLFVEEMTENSVGITCTSSDYPVRRLEACEAMLTNLKATLVDAVVILGEISYGDWKYI